ncbi:host attachment protein [Thioclava sp.]|uniref:host attachment protein n=1 Tax=Thioclava sp. TaxID=1933450 RepID=UPI003AA8683C
MTQGHIWVVVADATRARILRNADCLGENRLPELVMRAPHRHLESLMTHKTDETLGAVRSGARASDAQSRVTQDLQEFVRQIVALLESHRLAEDFNQLVLFLAPSVFALLHEELSPRLAATIISERCVNTLHLTRGAFPYGIEGTPSDTAT